MLMGELFYYDKFLDRIEFPLSVENLDQVKIFLVDPLDPQEFLESQSSEIAITVRDRFSERFLEVLTSLQLTFAQKFWNLLTSPQVSQDFDLNSGSEFQSELIKWMQDGFNLENLPEILSQGRLTSSEQDFALYYGLRVLYVLTEQPKKIDLEIFDFKESSAQALSNPTPDSEVLVICKQYLAPLFVNLNIQFSPITDDPAHALENVKRILKEFPKIKLIIIEETDNWEVVKKYLQKNLGNSVLVTSLVLEQNQHQTGGYFDALVKKTLGIRLPE